MFVKKLVEKASKKADGKYESLRCDEVDPRLVSHYGIPSASILLAYDPIQKILAVSTKDGRIKLLGRDHAQALLESTEAVPSKFLQFLENQGTLINVNLRNHIEVWDIQRRLMSCVHEYRGDITAFTLMQHTPYMYVGDARGNVSVLKLDSDACHVETMKYNIPPSASRGKTEDFRGDTAVICVLPQPAAECKRILIIFEDGFMTLWAIRESKTVFMTGGSVLPSLSHEEKKVTSACWACPFGSKVAIGYSNGEVLIWSTSPASDSKCESTVDKDLSTAQKAPICKLNLGYKLEKIPIAWLKWTYAGGKATRLYVMGAQESATSNLLQIVLLNEQTESRIIKLPLHPPEACLVMEIILSSREQSKHSQDLLVLIGKSGQIYAYTDNSIEKYLLQAQSKSSPSLPREMVVKLPNWDSSITVAKFMTNSSCMLASTDRDYDLLVKNIEPLLPFEEKAKEGTHSNSSHFGGFAKIKNLYITGHTNGSIKFWDLSCPIMLPVLLVNQQSEDDFSLSGVAVTALYFDSNSQLLVSGDQNGTVRIFKLKSESFGAFNSYLSIQGSTKKGSNNMIKSLKVIKIDGAVLCMNMNCTSRHLAVGSDLGYVSVIDTEGHNVVYQRHIPSHLCTGIISVQFESCSFHGFEKNVLVVATRDSSILALDADTGTPLSTNTVHPNKPSKALLLQVLDGQQMMANRSKLTDNPDVTNRSSAEEIIPKQSQLLLCSEKAVYVYSMLQIVQGVKKVQYKKKFDSSSCSWASVFYTKSTLGLILLFTSGKLEIRSLPELALLKESSIRGLTFPTLKQNTFCDISVCCSQHGDLIMVNHDQEIYFVSVLLQNDIYRPLDAVFRLYRTDLKVVQEGSPTTPKEKKGFFGSVLQDIRGTKPKHGLELEAEDTKESLEELVAIFSVENFPSNNESKVELDDEKDELDIDDIDLEDCREKPKAHTTKGVLNKQKLTSKFQALKGKLKQIKLENEKPLAKEESQDQKAGAVDQIKKKYGFSLSGEASAAKMAGNKLSENLTKLQGISMKTTQMQDTAKSFSFMAKEVLRSAEDQDRRPS